MKINRLYTYLSFLTVLLVAQVTLSQETFRDNFGAVSYDNSDGSVQWASDWIESGDTDLGPTGDYIYINNSRLYLVYLWSEQIIRTANLTGATTATLSFTYNSSSLGGQRQLGVYVSNNGGASYSQIATLNGSGTFSQNISGFISSNTTIRFAKSNQNWNNDDWAYVDNVQISVDNVSPQLSIADVTIDENGGNAVFTVTHVGSNTAGSFTVNYSSADGTATAGNDYAAVSGTLTFNGSAGDTETILVPILDDSLYESDEDFSISFNSVSNPSVITSAVGTGTINDDEIILDDVPLSLYRNLNGNYDYSTTGGTFRTEDNNTDPCAVTTTSSGNLTATIPGGASIKEAYLFWSHSAYTPDSEITFESTTVTADLVYSAGFTGRNFYGYIANVTDILSGISNPSSNTFDVTDLDIDTSSNFCNSATVLGAWSLMVFYEELSLPASTINLYYGFDITQNAGTSFTLDSFYAISPTGSKATFLSYEGDATLNGSSGGSTNPEELSITNQGGGNFILSGDGGQTGNNAYNSTLYDGPAGVNLSNMHGLDLDTYDISSYISSTDTEVTANVDVGQDLVISSAVVIRVPSNLISGTVFEDMNYPGGAGRNLATASGTGIEGARVEIFDSGNVFWGFTTTDANGDYSFGGMADGAYKIRVVNEGIRSTRGGGASCSSCHPVQTFRTEFDGTTSTDITNEIGGANPAATSDAGNATLSGAQTVSEINIWGGGIGNIDFGFNFNTIVNTNDSGQGSLEQFIINSNALAETGMDQEANSIFDPASGTDVSIFMIPPTSDPLGRTADVNYSGGVFNIDQSGNQLPDITDNDTRIDGRTQTAYSGDTNTGTIGAGGSPVGTFATVLPDYEQPEIQVHATNQDVFTVEATGTHIRNLSIYTLNNASSIRLNTGDNNLFTENSFGLDALGVQTPAGEYGIEINGGTSQITGNYFTGGNVGTNVSAGTSTEITYNHFDQVGNEACEDAIALAGGTGITIAYNLVDQTAAIGIEGWSFGGGASITENTVTASGQDGGNCSGSIENAGIRLFGSNSSITNNIIANNGGAGIVITDGSTSGNLISQNSIYANGRLGIDLDGTSTENPMGDDVTLNDSGDTDTGPNSLVNFPIISTVFISGSELVVKGWTRPGTTLEFFFTDINEGSATVGDNTFGLSEDYGEGQIFIGSALEGSIDDLDAGTSSYTDTDGNTDNTNQYEFRIPLPSGTTIGEWITGTATLSNSTSEFSPMSEIRVRTVITNRRITYRVNKG
ncbi:Calx-beta domain-containing protein [Pareuzebyella sediminis]|uniref:Calx-beta domain-containing protein n=1 Tax=Pareuzebyella sediminis TaxID=2607998 RepID=UPI0011ECDE10|nr:Calx-beta domain-containing protein [Pareuzebyella sediminis]